MSNYDELLKKFKEASAKCNGSDMMAAEYTINAIERDNFKYENLKDDDIDYYVRKGCNQIAEGNAEPEYENEDFYEEEPAEERVKNYVKAYIQYKIAERTK